jgi:pimeloyl-ACP methyl ester carboxylesterase
MPFYEKGATKIHYKEDGSGFPLLIIPSGGINGIIADATTRAPFDTFEEFKNDFRCITFDQRNAKEGQSSGPIEIERPWDSYTDDHLGLMDHLGIDQFLVLGFCIGGPFIWNMLQRASDRVVAGVLAQPVGFRPEMAGAFLSNMYRNNPDFVLTVTRDFVRACQTPLLILPDDVPGHPYAVAMESAMLAPNAQVSLYPWKEPVERIPLAVRHVQTFLRAHRPADA